MKHLVSKEGFLFVNKDFINGVIVAKELFIPDDYNLDLYMELPEQEALELQEKYNIETIISVINTSNRGGGKPTKIDASSVREITPEQHLSYQKAKEQALQEEIEQGNNT